MEEQHSKLLSVNETLPGHFSRLSVARGEEAESVWAPGPRGGQAPPSGGKCTKTWKKTRTIAKFTILS